jgi:hypothetical protein
MQVAYYVMPKDNRKYVVVSGKQRIMGADGVQSPEEYNNYAKPRLFTDHPRRIKTVEDRFNKSKMMPWAPRWIEEDCHRITSFKMICNNVLTY